MTSRPAKRSSRIPAGGHQPGRSQLPTRKEQRNLSSAAALTRIAAYDFPIQFNDANRAYFAGMAKLQAAKGETAVADAMNAFLRDPGDSAALAVTGRIRAGTPLFARPASRPCSTRPCHQRAAAARARQHQLPHFPRSLPESVRVKLTELVADPEVKVSMPDELDPVSPPPPLTPAVLGPLEKVTAEFWPGVPVLPVLQSGRPTAASRMPPASPPMAWNPYL